MAFPVKNASEWFDAGVRIGRPPSNHIKLCAVVLCKVDIVDEDEMFIPVFFIIADVVQVLWCCDSVRVVWLASPAAVSGIGRETKEKYYE